MPSRPVLRAFALILGLSLLVGRIPRADDEVGLYDYAMASRDGKESNLSAYRGKILVLELFATWCPPCKKDLPQVAALQESYPADQVSFVAVSADGTSRTVPNLPHFLEETGISIPVLIGGDVFMDRYAGVDQRGGRQLMLPQTYLFDRNGEIVIRLVGESKNKKKTLSQEIDRILGRKAGAS